MAITLVNPDGLPKPEIYRQVSIATGSKLVFVAGQVARDADGGRIGEGDLAAQAEQCFLNWIHPVVVTKPNEAKSYLGYIWFMGEYDGIRTGRHCAFALHTHLVFVTNSGTKSFTGASGNGECALPPIRKNPSLSLRCSSVSGSRSPLDHLESGT